MQNPLSQTNKLEELLSRQPQDLPLIEKLLKVDLISCKATEQELVDRNLDLRWFFQLGITLLDYYILLEPRLLSNLKVVPEDQTKPSSLLQELAEHHLYRNKSSTLINSRRSDYLQQARNYLKLREQLRQQVKKCLNIK